LSWKQENAINRIYRTFKRLKSGIFKEDIEALKHLNESVESGAKSVTLDNLLFSKLLCLVLKQNVMYYHDISISIKHVSDELDKTLNEQLSELLYALNQAEMIKKSEAGTLTAIDLMNNNKWTIEQVNSSFIKTANSFLTDKTKYF